MKKTYIIVGIIVLALLYTLSVYNGLVTANVGVDGQWAQVEAQYQRRLDLIPNLVESVKGVFKQEQSIFTALAEARAHYANATGVNAKAQAAGEVEGALSRLLAIVENYPELKSSENVTTLMAQLEGTENRVSIERKRFNDAVQTYNLRTKRFPSSVVASLFGFNERTYFEAAPGAENTPQVQF
ncbi:MAG: LemA family protein [Candidatus Taylorbacteria bacterium]|nr:LemA family protein [Candidatus Taylorbacteria bacterium]